MTMRIARMWTAAALILTGLACPGCPREPRTVTHTYTDVTPPADKPDDPLSDDVFDSAKAPGFQPTLVDSRPLRDNGTDWVLNLSAAVLKLDVPVVRPDTEARLLVLHPSYAAAAKNADGRVLPSVNLIDGKAKQFDDGLYAAIQQAHYAGLEGKLRSHVDLVRKLYDRAGPANPASAYLAAGLELAGVKVEPADGAAKAKWLASFAADEPASKPIGFYTWNRPLSDCFRFLRFFQHEFERGDLTVPAAVAVLLRADDALRDGFGKANAFYARLDNPPLTLPFGDLAEVSSVDAAAFDRLCDERKVGRRAASLFPASSSRETLLFERLFPGGLPATADLMREIIRRIRSGEVDLTPKPGAGWYDHQVYALETLLLPERGDERGKLLLTKRYKKRMLDAFAAMVTTRKETHVIRDAPAGVKDGPPPPQGFKGNVAPRLRVEPCPTYYLRTARAYSFLSNVLEAALGADGLKAMHGLTADGPRRADLYSELASMRGLFYGLYQISCEDIGVRPYMHPGECADPAASRKAAEAWLTDVFADPDLAADVRVSIPIYLDGNRRRTRLWTVLGVRLAKLNVRYDVAPKVRPAAAGDGTAWQDVETWRTAEADYRVPVAEFAEVELPGLHVLTREELRAACKRGGTREGILKILGDER